MFLNRLNEEEKVAFLELAHYIAKCDNKFLDEEKKIIDMYCTEMQIQDIEFNKETMNLELTVSKIQDKKSQKIILIEIMALVYADNVFNEEEKKVLEKIISTFGFNSEIVAIYREWSKAILALTVQGELLINL